MKITAIAATTLASVLLSAGAAHALAPAGKCEARELRASGGYASCRLDVNARAAANGQTPSFADCDAVFGDKWLRAEGKGNGQCPSSSDQAAIRDFIARCTDGVASALSGGSLPTCGGSPAGAVVHTRARADRRGEQCVLRKLQAAAGYTACRANVAAAALRGGGTPEFRKCDHAFSAGWAHAEKSGKGQCASSDLPAVQRFLVECTGGVATALGGGPLSICPAVDEWPVYGHDHQNSRANALEHTISPDNVARLGARWNISGLSAVTSTPAVVDGAVYFGDWTGVFHAVRASDGTQIWSRNLGSPIRQAPLVAGDRVYTPVSGGNFYALRRDTGDVVWMAPLDTQPLLSIDSSPTLAGNTIVMGVASFEQAIRKTDYTFRGNVVGLDADTGQVRWRVYTSQNDATSGAGVSVWSSAAVDDRRKLVYIGTGQTYEQPASPRGDSIIAIRYDTGDVAWVHQFTPNDVFTVAGGGPGPDADVGASPNLFTIDGRDVLGVGQKNGFYHVLDRATGALVWERQLTTGSPLGGVMVTAAVGNGAVFVNSNKWKVFGIFTGTQSPLDTSSTFALDARTGAVLWEAPMPAPMFGALTYANGVVYHGTIDGTVHALSAATGAELWSDKPGGDIAGGFSIVGGTLYVGRGFWFMAPPPVTNGGLVAYSLTPDHWVGTWSTSPICLDAATILGLPPSTKFENQTLRMVVHTSLGSDTLRVRLTNGCGSTPLVIGAASVGIRDTGASIRPGTDRMLTFGHHVFVSIPAGSTVTSDPVALTLPPLSDLAITLYLPLPTLPGTSHPMAATGYVSGAGDFTTNVDGTPFATTTKAWFFLDNVDVLAGSAGGAIVAFGDSIIDGAGSTLDANTRWPDFLARRLVAARKPFGVLNQGIDANRVLNPNLAESGLARFDRDALGQAGVKYVILLEGINDIGLGNPLVTADQVIAGYRQLIDRAHAAGLKIYGGTLTPALGTPIPFYAPYDESKRVAINQFIRESGEFDAVIDFAAAVTTPEDPAHWKAGLSADLLHPNDAGAEALGGAVDLSLFR